MVSAPSTRVAWCTTTGSRKPFPPFPRSISSWEGLFSHPIKLFFTCSQTHPKKKKRGAGKAPTRHKPPPPHKKPWQQPTLPPHHRAVPSAKEDFTTRLEKRPGITLPQKPPR